MSPSRQTVSVFFAVFVALMLLLALTVETARHDLGRWNFVVSTLIAAAKAVLIILYFMHVRRSARITKLLVCAGFFWLAILFTLSLADYWTRDWLSFIMDESRRVCPVSELHPRSPWAFCRGIGPFSGQTARKLRSNGESSPSLYRAPVASAAYDRQTRTGTMLHPISGAVWTQQRNTSATLQAWAMHPRN